VVPKQRLQEGKTTLTGIIVAKLSLGTTALAEEASPHHATRMGNDAKSSAVVGPAKPGARISLEMPTKHPNRGDGGSIQPSPARTATRPQEVDRRKDKLALNLLS
jgi:hypothetical protein